MSDILLEHAPATLALALFSGMLAIGFGIVLGVFTATCSSFVAADPAMAVSLMRAFVPIISTGNFLVHVFSVALG